MTYLFFDLLGTIYIDDNLESLPATAGYGFEYELLSGAKSGAIIGIVAVGLLLFIMDRAFQRYWRKQAQEDALSRRQEKKKEISDTPEEQKSESGDTVLGKKQGSAYADDPIVSNERSSSPRTRNVPFEREDLKIAVVVVLLLIIMALIALFPSSE